LADCLLIAGTTDRILIAGTLDCILIAVPVVPVIVGGPSGGKSKAKGYRVISDELGNRPVKHTPSLTKGKLKLKIEGLSKGRIQIPVSNIIKSTVEPFNALGISISQIQIKTRMESIAQMTKRIQSMTIGGVIPNMGFIKQDLNNLKDLKKAIELFMLYQMSESTDKIFTGQSEQIKSFKFNESAEEWQGILTEQRFRAFTASSSFVGNVRYDRDEQSMRILLNGIPYQFCNVPERIFDSFEGANSKGAFFNRNIKTQFDC